MCYLFFLLPFWKNKYLIDVSANTPEVDYIYCSTARGYEDVFVIDGFFCKKEH